MRVKLLERRLDDDEDACEFHGDDALGIEDSGGQLNGPRYGVRVWPRQSPILD